MKCKKGTGDCKLELKFYDNGDVSEFCLVCDFSYLHEVKNIKNSELNPINKKD
jgi:hypothetical protein